jgi:catalase
LAQIYNIAPEYSQGVYDALPEKKFEFSEVEELSKNAQEWYKEPKFRPSSGERLVGFAPLNPVYNV